MRSSISLPPYSARLRVIPRPVTLSESSAILHQLKVYGNVSRFAPLKPGPVRDDDTYKDTKQGCQSYTVAFSSLEQQLQQVYNGRRKESGKHSLDFVVTANAHHHHPRELDPYNVRGLLDRKPTTLPRAFQCILELGSNVKLDESEDLDTNEYALPFEIESKSEFESVLRRTDAPRVFHEGLAPRVRYPEDTLKQEETGLPSKSSDLGETGGNLGNNLQKGLGKKTSGLESDATETITGEDFSLAKLYQASVKQERDRH